MIQTVHLDDTTLNGKKLRRELHRYKKGVRFDNPATNGTVPEGYMTSKEFRIRASIKVNKFCDKHGIL
ncbi:MAG: hypothetical protein LBS63_01105 [Prevotellaceae bacterium]|jgi:hypothetical protein|nr:hypothetical protein [Prevotellaceae bacterium]